MVDGESTLTLETGSKKQVSCEPGSKKYAQLAKAREKALLARRRKMKERLESKLSELRHVLGSDMRSQTVERFAEAIMRQEERLRSKQNALTEGLSKAMEGFRDELKELRRHIGRPSSVSLSQVKSSNKPRSSEVSTSSVSRRL